MRMGRAENPCVDGFVTGRIFPYNLPTLFLTGFVRFLSSLAATTMTARFIGGIGYLCV